MDRSEVVINEKMSVEPCSKGKSNRCFDIEKLEGMRDAIIKFENKKLPLRHCLLIIGKMSAGITVNGEIWKKYGCMKTGKNMSRDGVPFDKLSHLENIFYDRQIYSQITEKELGVIGKETSYLKNKLILQLKQCNEDKLNASEDISPNSNGSLSGIIDLSDKYFEMLTAKLIIREIKKWKAIDFNLKDDRYFIARLLSKIGEFLNELVKSSGMTGNVNENRKDSVMKAFKTLVQIRNKLVHNCSTVANGMQDLNETITGMMFAVREHLRQVFIKRSEMGCEFIIDYQYKHAHKFKDDSWKLMQCFTGKYMSVERHKKQLSELIIKAYGLLIEENNSKDDGGEKKKNTINKLKKINEQYQSHLGHLNELEKMAYPKILYMETKDDVIDCVDAVQNLLLNIAKGINNADDLQIWIGIRKHICETLGLKLQIEIQHVPTGCWKTVIIPDDYKELISMVQNDKTKIMESSETQDNSSLSDKKLKMGFQLLIKKSNKCNQSSNDEVFQYKIEVKVKETIQSLDPPLKIPKEINETEHYLLLELEIQYFTSDSFLKLEDKFHFLLNSWMKDLWTMVANSYEYASKKFYEELNQETGREGDKWGMVEEENIVAQATVSIFKCSEKLNGLVHTCQLKNEHTEKEFKQKYPNEMQQRESRNYEGFKLKVDALCKETIEMLMGKYISMGTHLEIEFSRSHDEDINKTNCHQRIDDSSDGEFQSSIKMKGLDHQVVIDCFIKECEFLVREYVEMELAEIEEMKRLDYIMQQAVSQMLQLIHDWGTSYFRQNNNDSSTEQDEHQQVLSCFQKYAASSYSRRELRSCNGHRSTGLSHKILRFDQITFLTETKGESLSFFDFLNWFHTAMCHDISSVYELYYVGFALFKINAFEESIKFLEKALHRADSHPEEVEQHEFDPYYIKVFGKPRLICFTLLWIIMNYEGSKRSEEMYCKIKEVVDNINEEELNQCNISEIKETVGGYYSLIAEYFVYTRRDFNEALYWYEKSESIHEIYGNKWTMSFIYLGRNDKDNFKKMQQSKNADSLPINALDNTFKKSLEFLESTEDLFGNTASVSRRDLTSHRMEMESLIAINKSFLKRNLRDGLSFLNFTMIDDDLIVLIDKINKNGVNEDSFKQLNEIDKKFHELKEKFKEERLSGYKDKSIYINLSVCYSYLFGSRDTNLQEDEECLDKAKKYYIYALKLIDPTLWSHESLLLHLKEESPECEKGRKDDSDVMAEIAKYIVHAQAEYCKKHLKEIDPNFLVDLVTEIEETHLEFVSKLFDKIFRYFMKNATENRWVVNDLDLGVSICYSNKIRLIADCNLVFIKYWLLNYYKLSNLSLTEKQKEKLRKQAIELTEILVNLGKVLLAILYEKEEPIQPSKLSIKFCRKKWDIDCRYENEKLLWKQDTHLQVKDIITELSHLGELFVINIFVMGYYKKDRERNPEQSDSIQIQM